ncbi:hypothetical protein KY329_03145 [Candidatus Woesearchaeota archaeon]|nr:hypothetical protein [Candidatus Woesearchaeota archaeon]
MDTSKENPTDKLGKSVVTRFSETGLKLLAEIAAEFDGVKNDLGDCRKTLDSNIGIIRDNNRAIREMNEHFRQKYASPSYNVVLPLAYWLGLSSSQEY